MQELLSDSIHRNRLMMRDSNPYLPSDLPGNELKRKLKVLHNYADGDILCKQKSRARLEDPKLLTSGTEDSVEQKHHIELSMIERKPAGQQRQLLHNQVSNRMDQVNRTTQRVPEPHWHANWELSSVISGHLGWVRSIAFDPSNEWFATGSADRTIKIWDLGKCCAGAEGGLKLTLTGHVHTVRGLAVSSRHPYLFSAGEDKLVKCWDLEYNKVIRHYHGHLSGVFCIDMHPTLDLLFTGGRDSVCRVWDMRTKTQIHVLGGHTNAVSSLIVNGVDPQVITGSHDSTIKLWDLAAGKSMCTLTQHKKAVRSLHGNLRDFTFISGGADNLKKWQCRDGKFIRNFSNHSTPINAVAINDDGVAVSCGDNGSINFWDYETGYCFQKTNTIVQPGSLDAESCVYAAKFDLSGSRLLTCEADKTIKIWKESDQSSEETHPIDMKGWAKECLALKRY